LAPFQLPVATLADAVHPVVFVELQAVVTFAPDSTVTGPPLPLTVSVTVGAGGTVLDQKEFTFKTNKAKNKTTSIVNNKYVIGSIIVFVLIAIFGLYMNRKKKINSVKM
jgi:hypothetical protein